MPGPARTVVTAPPAAGTENTGDTPPSSAVKKIVFESAENTATSTERSKDSVSVRRAPLVRS